MHMNADSWKAIGHHATYGLNAEMDETAKGHQPYIDNAGIPEHFTSSDLHVLPLRKGQKPRPPPKDPIYHGVGSSRSRNQGQSRKPSPASSGGRRVHFAEKPQALHQPVAPAVQSPSTQGGSSHSTATGHTPRTQGQVIREPSRRPSMESMSSWHVVTPPRQASPSPGGSNGQKTVPIPKVARRIQRKSLRPPSAHPPKPQGRQIQRKSLRAPSDHTQIQASNSVQVTSAQTNQPQCSGLTRRGLDRTRCVHGGKITSSRQGGPRVPNPLALKKNSRKQSPSNPKKKVAGSSRNQNRKVPTAPAKPANRSPKQTRLSHNTPVRKRQ